MTNSNATPVRILTAADAPAYRLLRLQALGSAPEAFGASLPEEAERPLSAFAERLAPPAPSLVFGAFVAGGLVGTAGFLAATSTKSRHKGTLWGVYVTPQWRGRGLARLLVEAVVAHARMHVLILNANVVTTNAAARALYEKLGFRSYGIEAKALCVDGVFHDEALLALDFSTSPAVRSPAPPASPPPA